MTAIELLEEMRKSSYTEVAVAIIMYEKECEENEAHEILNEFMEDDTKTSLLNMED